MCCVRCRCLDFQHDRGGSSGAFCVYEESKGPAIRAGWGYVCTGSVYVWYVYKRLSSAKLDGAKEGGSENTDGNERST